MTKRIICPWGKEDYDNMYGSLNFKGKIVLEIGAEIGSTAQFFLERGAVKVISVEREDILFEQLKENFKDDKRVIPLKIDIQPNVYLEWLILKYLPDIVHMDCEGCEVVLLENVDNWIFQIPDAYQIEVHHEEIRYNKFIKKFKSLGYKIIKIIRPQGENTPLWVINVEVK